MTQILTGNIANDGTGSTLRDGGLKIDQFGLLSDKTVDAAFYKTASNTNEQAITNAITDCVNKGYGYVRVGAGMLPYNASLVTFNNLVIMLGEGCLTGANLFDSRAYGAQGVSTAGGGVASDVAINAAISAASGFQGGGIVLLPPGNIRLDAPINLKANVSIRGAGQAVVGNASTLLWTTSGAATIIFDSTPFVNILCVLSDFTIDGSGGGTPTGHGIKLHNGTNATIERVTIQNSALPASGFYGILLDNANEVDITTVSILDAQGAKLINGSGNCTIKRCSFEPPVNGTGVTLSAGITTTLLLGNNFEGASRAGTIGVDIGGAEGTVLIGNFFEYQGTACVKVPVNSFPTTFIGNTMIALDTALACIDASASSYGVYLGNSFQQLGLASRSAIAINQGSGALYAMGNKVTQGGNPVGAGSTMIRLNGVNLTVTDLELLNSGELLDASVALVSGATPAIDPNLGSYFTLNILTNIAVTVAVPVLLPVGPSLGFTKDITIAIRNGSGAALTNGIPTFNTGANGFKFGAGSLLLPGNGQQVEYRWRWDPVQSFWYLLSVSGLI
jgi:hypothetical protein